MNICTICDEIIANGKWFNSKAYRDLVEEKLTIIYSTEHFVVLPSLGALNKSHILIAPKDHYISFSRLPLEWDDEVNYIKEHLRAFCKNKYDKELIFFEHGAGSTSNTSGACIDHAHLHGIWDIKDFVKTLFEELMMDQFNKFGELHNKANKLTGYIFLEDTKKRYWIANNPDAPSQYFRHLYTKIGKLKTNWDWRSAPQIDNIINVLKNYKDLKNLTTNNT